jgi:hypothetical protein
LGNLHFLGFPCSLLSKDNRRGETKPGRTNTTTMPRSRPRAKVIKKLNDIIFKRSQFAFLRHVVFDDDDLIEDLIDLQYESYLHTVS